MTIKELEQRDEYFSVNGFSVKANNMFVKVISSYMLDNLEEVKHFISKDIYEKIKSEIEENKNNNIRKMYDELNVSGGVIINVDETEDSYIIEYRVVTKYLDYIINYDTAEYISGNNDHRIERTYYLTFRKYKKATDQGVVRRCDNCGMSMDVNNNGICNYCNTSYNQDKHDWVMVGMHL